MRLFVVSVVLMVVGLAGCGSTKYMVTVCRECHLNDFGQQNCQLIVKPCGVDLVNCSAICRPTRSHCEMTQARFYDPRFFNQKDLDENLSLRDQCF